MLRVHLAMVHAVPNKSYMIKIAFAPGRGKAQTIQTELVIAGALIFPNPSGAGALILKQQKSNATTTTTHIPNTRLTTHARHLIGHGGGVPYESVQPLFAHVVFGEHAVAKVCPHICKTDVRWPRLLFTDFG